MENDISIADLRESEITRLYDEMAQVEPTSEEYRKLQSMVLAMEKQHTEDNKRLDDFYNRNKSNALEERKVEAHELLEQEKIRVEKKSAILRFAGDAIKVAAGIGLAVLSVCWGNYNREHDARDMADGIIEDRANKQRRDRTIEQNLNRKMF